MVGRRGGWYPEAPPMGSGRRPSGVTEAEEEGMEGGGRGQKGEGWVGSKSAWWTWSRYWRKMPGSIASRQEGSDSGKGKNAGGFVGRTMMVERRIRGDTITPPPPTWTKRRRKPRSLAQGPTAPFRKGGVGCGRRKGRRRRRKRRGRKKKKKAEENGGGRAVCFLPSLPCFLFVVPLLLRTRPPFHPPPHHPVPRMRRRRVLPLPRRIGFHGKKGVGRPRRLSFSHPRHPCGRPP